MGTGTTGSRSCGNRWTCAQVWILAAVVLCLKLPESPFLCQSQEVPGRLDEVGLSSADTEAPPETYSGVAIVGFTLNFPELGVIFDSRSQEVFVREYIRGISLAVGWDDFVETRVLAITAGRVSTAVYYQSPNWQLPSSAISPRSLGITLTDNPASIFSDKFLNAYGYPALSTAVSTVLTTPSPVMPQDTPSSVVPQETPNFPPGLTTATPWTTLQGPTPAEDSTNTPSLPPYQTEAAAEDPLESYLTPASTYHNHTVDPSPGRNESCSKEPSIDCGLRPQVRIVTACEEADCSGQQAPLDSSKPLSFLAYIEGPLNGFSPQITYLWACGANYSVPLADDVLEAGSSKTNQLLKILPAQLPGMPRRLFVLSVMAKNETSGLSSKATVEVHLSYPPSCEGVPNSFGYSPCIKVLPEEGIALGKTSFSVLTSGWASVETPVDAGVELRFKYGYLSCTEPATRCANSSISSQQSHAVWISDFTAQSSFNISALPAGAHADDYQQAIIVCVAVAKLGVVQPAEACGVQQVQVLPLGSENQLDESWIQEKLEQIPSLANPDALAMLLAISKSLEAQPQSSLDLHGKLIDRGHDLLNSTGPGLALTSSVVQMSKSIAVHSNATELADIADLLQQATLLGNTVEAQGPKLASQLSSAALDAVSTILVRSAEIIDGLQARELVVDVLQSTRAVVSQLATSISGGRLPGDVDHFGGSTGRMRLSIITGYPETMGGKVLSLEIPDRHQVESPLTRRLLAAADQPFVALSDGFVSFCAQSTVRCSRPLSIALSYTSSNSWLLAGMGQAAFADAVARYLAVSAEAIKSALRTVIISGVIGVELLHVSGVASFGFGDSFHIIVPLDAQLSTPSNDVSRFCVRIDYANFQPEVVGMADVSNGFATCNATFPGDYTIIELIHAGESTTSAIRYHGVREGDEKIDVLQPDNFMLQPIALAIPSSAIGIAVVMAALAGFICLCCSRAFAGHPGDGELHSYRFSSDLPEDAFPLRKRESYDRFLERVVSHADDAAVETPTDDPQAAPALWSDDPGVLYPATGDSDGRPDIAAWASQGIAPWIYSQSKRFTLVRTKTALLTQKSGATLSHLMASSKSILQASLTSAWRQSKAKMEATGLGYASGPGRPPTQNKHVRILDTVASGNTKLVEALLRNRKGPLPCNVAGQTPLHIAAMIGCVDIIEILLQWSDQREDTDIGTALINVKDYSGRTCLHLAGQSGKHMVVEALFRHRGRHSICPDIQDADGRTALHLCAIDSDHGGTASALIFGASKTRVMAADQPDRDDNHTVTAWTDEIMPHYRLSSETARSGTNVTIRDKFGWTALHLAAGHGRIQILSEILSPESLDAQNLEAGSLINLQDHEGWTAMHLAAARGRHDAARVLITHPECSLRICDWDGWTVLHIAAVYGQQAIVPSILEQCLQRNIEITEETDASGKPALQYATMYGHVSIVRRILKFEDKIRSLKAKQDPRRLEGSSSATYASFAGIHRLWFTVSFGLSTSLPPVGRQLMRFLTGETSRQEPSATYQEELDHGKENRNSVEFSAWDASSPEAAIHEV